MPIRDMAIGFLTGIIFGTIGTMFVVNMSVWLIVLEYRWRAYRNRRNPEGNVTVSSVPLKSDSH